MIRVTIDGVVRELDEGLTILQALARLGTTVPHVCHDERLRPAAVCRLCLVEVEGQTHPVPSCATPLVDGQVVATRTAALEEGRRMTLAELARHYPADAVERAPSREFHRLLRDHGVEAAPSARDPALVDDSHPYLRVDMSQCILCLRCVRICDEVQGTFAWRVWNKGEETRVVPDTGTTLRESSCVSCGACADTCPTGAIEDRFLSERGAPDAWTRTTCPYCGVGCELEAGTRDARLVQLRPARDAPVNRGHLCSKGRYAFDYVHADDRLTTPLLRAGTGFRRATWDEALGVVATGLRRILDEHGPSAIGVLGSARATNEDNYLIQKFARVVLGTNNVDCCARVCHAPSATALSSMLGTAAATGSFDDVERARTLLVWGCNPTEAHPVVGARVKQARLAGAHLVVVDPRRTELAAYADVHLAPHPGTDVALLNAFAHVVLAEGLLDRAFVEARVDELPAFEQWVAPWTPERAAAVCGVDADAIRRAARLYARERPSMAMHGLGVTEHVAGTDGVMGLVNLALLTGNLGRPGAGVNPLRGQNNVQGSALMGCEPGHLTGAVPLSDGARFAAVWGVQPPSARGLDLLEMLDAARDGRLKALWAVGYDVLFTMPDAERVRNALSALDLLVVQELFLDTTAQAAAHVVLPAAGSFEKEGTFMNAERRVQRVRRAVDPPGEARADWRIVCDLARAMGRSDGFEHADARAIWNEIRQVWPAGAGMSWERLEEHGLQWPCPDETHPGTTTLHEHAFRTGRAVLRRLTFVPSPERCDAAFPFVLTTGRTLHQFNAGTMTGRTRHSALRPGDLLEMHPDDARNLGLSEGDRVRVHSRHGSAELPVTFTDRMRPGELFATFHSPDVFLNRLVSPALDRLTHTPEYKVTAVRVERVDTR